MSRVLEINHLTKYFTHSQRNKPVLNDISFQADQRDIISILGPSGSGKSTLLRCINFLEIPSQGEIVFKNQSIDIALSTSPKELSSLKELPKQDQKKIIGFRKKIAMVFQNFNLWSHLNVLENITEAPLVVLKKEKKLVVEKAHQLLKKVGLSDFGHYYPAQLSGGQKQRVAIARALAMEPEVILFDEPTSALDPELVQEVLKVIHSLREDNLTLLIVSHEIQFSKDVSNKTLFLFDGKVEEQGTTKEVFRRPKSVKLKQFLSSLNLR